MKYIEVNQEGLVTLAHNMPFHEIHGLGKSEAELNETGYLVADIPEPEFQPGFTPVLRFDVTTKTFSYDQVELPLSVEEEVSLLKEANKSASERFIAMVGVGAVTVAELREAKINQLKELCTKAIFDGFTSSTGHSFGFNELDQANFTQQSVLVMMNGLADTEIIKWKSKAGIVDLTVAEFKVIVEEAKDHKLAMQAKFWQLEALALAATTKSAIQAINW